MEKEYLLKKWLDNNLSEEETKAFKALEDAKLYEEIIEEAQRFNGNHHVKVSSFETLEERLHDKKSDSSNWMKMASGIAAALIIGMALFALWNTDKTSIIKTEYAQKESIILPDNSKVELNELSQLQYNKSNWNKERILELNGEAYFDVEKGKRFDVNTEFGKVSVLGTEFNVLSRDSIFKVSCYEGLVQVTYNTKVLELPAGSEFILKSGNVQKTNTALAGPYWLKNMSVFENASIDDVIIELENQYNIKVITNVNDNNLRFTGAFEHDNLNSALKSITQPLDLTYEITNDKKVTIRNAKD